MAHARIAAATTVALVVRDPRHLTSGVSYSDWRVDGMTANSLSGWTSRNWGNEDDDDGGFEPCEDGNDNQAVCNALGCVWLPSPRANCWKLGFHETVAVKAAEVTVGAKVESKEGKNDYDEEDDYQDFMGPDRISLCPDNPDTPQKCNEKSCVWLVSPRGNCWKLPIVQ